MKQKISLLLACFPLLLASCDRDDVGNYSPEATGTNGDITFEIGFAPTTRVSTAMDFTSAWETGDEIGVFAVAHGSLLATDGSNYINNVKLTYNGTSWTQAKALYWPVIAAGIPALDFYAYYPYTNSAVDPTKIVFNVKTDQSGTTNTGGTDKSNYALSDLLTSKSDNSGAGYSKGQTVSLQFSHALSMVQVGVPIQGKGFGPSKNLVVILRNVKPGALLNLSRISATRGSEMSLQDADNEAENITMRRVEQSTDANYETAYTYRVLVPTQSIAAGNSLFRFNHEGRQMLTDGVLTQELSMSAGQAERFERTLPVTVTHTVSVQAGSFSMGSPNGEDGRSANETQHNVTLTKGFYMSKYLVTTTQYAAFLNATGVGEDGKDGSLQFLRSSEATLNNRGLNWDKNGSKWIPVPGCENHPMINVSWFGALAYANWVGGNLATEAQWEYACRAGTTTAYSYGDKPDKDYMWCGINNDPYGSKEVGLKKPNPWGLYDMHGNVREWCMDWYDVNYGSLTIVTDPTGPASGTSRLLRGGNWLAEVRRCRSAFRNSISPGNLSNTGFRVVFAR